MLKASGGKRAAVSACDRRSLHRRPARLRRRRDGRQRLLHRQRGARFSTARSSRTAAASRSAASCTSTRGCREAPACRCSTSRSAIPRRSIRPKRRRRSTQRSTSTRDVFNLEAGDDVRARAAQTYAKFLRKTHAQDAALDEHRTSSRRRAVGRRAAADAGHAGRQGRRRDDARARRDGAPPARSDQATKGR